MSLYSMLACLIGFAIAFACVPVIIRFSRRAPAWRRSPDFHHTHKQPIPRLGGLALLAAFLGTEGFVALTSSGAWLQTPSDFAVFFGSLAMFGLGFWDDLKPLGARKKLLGQVLIACGVCACGLSISALSIPFTGTKVALHGAGIVLTMLWLVGITNLINLIDGADGLAGGICLMLMLLLAYTGRFQENVGLLACGMAGALLGFLKYNFPPARIYLGDGGAYFLGFLIGVLSLVNSHKGSVFAALAAPMFVLALPILDTSIAILRRGLRGLPIFRPDRRHLHHHLQGIGFSHRKVVWSFYGVTLIFLLLGFGAVTSAGHWVPGLLGVGMLVLLICAGNLSFSRSWFDIGNVVGNSLEMRREIQYALSLMRWLELDGDRCKSLDDLWASLLFTAQKLDFTAVTLTLKDARWHWQHPEAREPSQSRRQDLQGEFSGALELRAAYCARSAHIPPGVVLGLAPCDPARCPCVSEDRLFEILTELVAEGWTKAVARWRRANPTPLSPAPEPASVAADPTASSAPSQLRLPGSIAMERE